MIYFVLLLVIAIVLTFIWNQERPKEIKYFSKVCEERKAELLSKIIVSSNDSPHKAVTFKSGTLEPLDVTARNGTKKRVGKPRVKWVETGMQQLWDRARRTIRPDLIYVGHVPERSDHQEAIKHIANKINNDRLDRKLNPRERRRRHRI